jgi:4-hydroxybenzoate polyprenyltransferase
LEGILLGYKRKSWKHFFLVFILSFLLAVIAAFGSEILMERTNTLTALILLLIIVGINIGFDIIGIAATAATEKPHHAKAANRVQGARQTVYLVRNADTVANFANDIVGDVTGALSGGMAASIVLQLIQTYPTLETKEIWLNTLMIGLVASLTVTGKALGKSFAIYEADEILGRVGSVIARIEGITGLSFTDKKRKGGKRSGDSRKNKST